MAELDEFIRLLTNADRVLVFTGAGISTTSGIPDFRGPKGVWNTRTPVMFQDFLADEKDQHRYWQQKSEDWTAFAAARPTPAHLAIAELHQAGRLLLCVTQNIDGLHLDSGVPAEALVEIHGSNKDAECMDCHAFEDAAPHYDDYLESKKLPACSACGGLLKPGVISFGQSLREADLTRIQDLLFDADLVIAMGTTLQVMPAASLPLLAARQNIPYVVINKGPTAHDGHPLVSCRLEGGLDEIVPAAVQAALAFSG